MQRVEIVSKEDRQREKLCWSYQDALGVLSGMVAESTTPDSSLRGTEWEVWTIADDETETRMSLLAEVLIP